MALLTETGELMPARPQDRQGAGGTSLERAEELLRSLTGVMSARVVTGVKGDIEEIHVLTTEEIGPKQTVRNVESALRAHLGLEVDHRRISVAQQKGKEDSTGTPISLHPGRPERRILFLGHRAEPEKPYRVRMHVEVEWQGEQYTGEAVGADLPRSRLETAAHATLRGLEVAIATSRGGAEPTVALALDGVKLVETFEHTYTLVALHAIGGREMVKLSGAVRADGPLDRAVILATLQATDRWVRGRFKT